MKPYEDPKTFVSTQRQLIRNDMIRLNNISRTSERVKLMSQDKKRRSRILGDISEGVISQSEPVKKYSTAARFFGQVKKSKVLVPKTISQQKLATSFDFNKFRVVPRFDCVNLISR